MENTDKWIILQIRDNYDFEFEDIKKSLLDFFIEEDVFVPTYHETVGSYVSRMVLFEGYAFVKDNFNNRQVVSDDIKNKSMFEPLSFNGKLKTIPGCDINKFKDQILQGLSKKFSVGVGVLVTQGPFRHLVGKVIEVVDGGKNVMVEFSQRSRRQLAVIPVTCLEEV